MLTEEQAAWASQFIGIEAEILLAGLAAALPLDAPPAPDTEGAAPPANGALPAPPDAAAPAATMDDLAGTNKVSAFPIPIPPIPNPVGELTADVTISNRTNFTLTLDTSSGLTSGELKSGQIKPVLKKDDETSFVVRSNDIGSFSVTDAEGTIKYLVGDTKAVWSCHFVTTRNPLKPNGADSTLSPDVEGVQKPQANHTTGQNAKMTFLLIGQGGDQPTPSGDTLLSCRVTVVNQTQQTVFLRDQDNAAGGDFVTNPVTSLAPGASTNFVYEETQNSKNHNCRGTMLWDVGDPKLTSWSLMWDNQRNAKNLSAGLLTPDDGTFHTLDQIDNGDENVPVTFTLSGGGTGPRPGAKPVTCQITVINQTDQPMKSAGSGGASGTFQTQPPASIAAGGQAQFTFDGATDDPKKGAQGFVQWIVGEKDDAAWLINWSKPGDGASKVDGKVLPDGTSFASSAAAADANDGSAAMTFTLSGKGGQKPTPTIGQHFVIAVNNKSESDLVLSAAPGLTGGKLKTSPPGKLAAGNSLQIDFIPDTPGQPAGGTMEWKTDPDGKAVWDLTWTIQPNGDAKADAVVAPPDSGFTSDAKTLVVDDGAGLVYTLTGKGGGTPDQPDDEFAPPPKSKQPTLRVKDESPDGWIEYAQRLLNKWVLTAKPKGFKVDTVNGVFDPNMKKKVEGFQSAAGCKSIDGVIGNETWSLLREGTREAVGTDGRKPHTFEQTDAQGRFVTENPDVTGYDASKDEYHMLVVSTGEKPIDDAHCTVKITQPDGTSHTHKVKIGGVTSPSGDGQGDIHTVLIKDFKRTFKIDKDKQDKPVVPLSCTVDAYLDKEIGGDRFIGPVTGPGSGPQPTPADPPTA